MQKMILLIDDDQEELHILSHALQVAGLPHSCVWAIDVERAEKLLQEILPDYIFIDYNMPKVNGIDCLQQIRRIRGMQDVPMILYSSAIDERIRFLAMSNGASSCIEKPNSVARLVEYLTRIMGEGKLLHNTK